MFVNPVPVNAPIWGQIEEAHEALANILGEEHPGQHCLFMEEGPVTWEVATEELALLQQLTANEAENAAWLHNNIPAALAVRAL